MAFARYDSVAMRVKIRYFAVLRERLGLDAEHLELVNGACVADAVKLLCERHCAVAAMRSQLRVARNLDMVSSDTALCDGDELAFIPPVAGGSDAVTRVARMVHERAPSLDVCVDAVRSRDKGAICTFVGVVRCHNLGRDVERLEYEAYDEMANKVFTRLCIEIEGETLGSRLAVEHRAGKLVVGDIAVVVAAAAPHRAEAFKACRDMIERLKQEVPIWKKEIGPDGVQWLGSGA